MQPTWFDRFTAYASLAPTAESEGILRNVVSQWPLPARPHAVQAVLQGQAPPRSGSANMPAFQATRTLYPAYSEALAAACGADAHIVHALACWGQEANSMAHLSGMIHQTSAWGEYVIPLATKLPLYEEAMRRAMLVSSLAIAPGNGLLNSRHTMFPTSPTQPFIGADARAFAEFYTCFLVHFDTMLIPYCLFEGGGNGRTRQLNDEVRLSATPLTSVLEQLGCPQPRVHVVARRPTRNALLDPRLALPLHARDPARRRVEATCRIVAHNLQELVRLTFRQEQLPAFQAVANALGGAL